MGLKKNKEEKTIHYSKNSKLPAILVIAIVVLSIILGITMGSKWQQTKANKKITIHKSPQMHCIKKLNKLVN